MGSLTTLAVIAIALKLLGVVTWSWWLVTAPIWVPVALVLVVTTLTFIGKVMMLGIS